MKRDRDKFVWRVTQEPGKDARLEIGSMLDELPVHEYLPLIASTLIDMGSFMFKVCLENNNISVEEPVAAPEETVEDYDFE